VALTRELDRKDSPVTRWFNQWLANTKPVSEEWSARVRSAPTHRPDSDKRIPGTVGTAFDYRLRFSLAALPLERTVAATGMRLLDTTRSQTRNSGRSTDEFLVTYGLPPGEAAPVARLLSEFQEALATTLLRFDPVGRALRGSEEELLCRYCYVLALFEELYRAGLAIKSPLFTLASGATLDRLLALPPQIWVDDLCKLSHLARPHLADLGHEPLHLNPTFAGSSEIGGADADLIAGGCLLDIKTTVDPKFSRTRLLYQLLGYVLLDYPDAYAITCVGIYLSRQSLVVRWPLQELLSTLLAERKATLPELRMSFRAAIHQR